MMEDFNARMGRDATIWGEVIGRYEEEVMSRNGQKLLGLCAANELVVLIPSTSIRTSISTPGKVKEGGSDPSLTIL